MAEGTVLAAWKDEHQAYLAVRVTEADGRNVEYIGSVPVDTVWNALDGAGQQVALEAAVKAVRDASLASTSDLTLSGTVTV